MDGFLPVCSNRETRDCFTLILSASSFCVIPLLNLYAVSSAVTL
ncbi:MAG: hypothetical protein ACE14O_06710 [Candidatus Cloacimonadaceae bacterium]|nr:hypothetical protein [Candidatus Cloacimonadota bacterium]HQL14730.1 hypothetical protein [Candidatus Cloacimonadota bacterium]